MTKKYDLIPSTSLEKSAYVHPPRLPKLIHLEDPALTAMIDLSSFRLYTIKKATSVTVALEEMKAAKTRSLLVVDGTDRIIGLISSEDLQGGKVTQAVNEDRVPRDEISVSRVMTPYDKILAFHRDDVKHTKVGNVVASLIDGHRSKALVVDADPENEDEQIVVGMFSASVISRGVGHDVMSTLPGAHTISEMNRDFS